MSQISLSQTLTSFAAITILELYISDTIKHTLNVASPNKTKNLKYKVWWDSLTMDPLRREDHWARKEAKTHPTDENGAIYSSAPNWYGHLIDLGKAKLWRRYLSNLMVGTLLQAKRYTSSPRPSSFIATLIDKGRKLMPNKWRQSARDVWGKMHSHWRVWLNQHWGKTHSHEPFIPTLSNLTYLNCIFQVCLPKSY